MYNMHDIIIVYDIYMYDVCSDMIHVMIPYDIIIVHGMVLLWYLFMMYYYSILCIYFLKLKILL